MIPAIVPFHICAEFITIWQSHYKLFWLIEGCWLIMKNHFFGSLNSELYTFKAGILPLEPHLQPQILKKVLVLHVVVHAYNPSPWTQEDHELKTSLGYTATRPSLKKKKVNVYIYVWNVYKNIFGKYRLKLKTILPYQRNWDRQLKLSLRG
jgi:hypothetical protein